VHDWFYYRNILRRTVLQTSYVLPFMFDNLMSSTFVTALGWL